MDSAQPKRGKTIKSRGLAESQEKGRNMAKFQGHRVWHHIRRKAHHIPAVISMFVLTAQISELTSAVQRISIWEMAGTAALFALWLAIGEGIEPKV